MRQVLTIVGSSARAAAVSAVRSGFAVFASDLFADVDLCRVAQATRVGGYPAGLSDAIQGNQPGAWIYTGALENYPALIDAWALRRPLWGNRGELIRRVRSPTILADALVSHGLRVPRVTTDVNRVPTDGSWLFKPLKSAGGLRIAAWRGFSHSDLQLQASGPSDWYFQERIAGRPHAAIYVMAGGRAVLLGVTEQMIGTNAAASEDFHYRGSIGPIVLSPHDEATTLRIGSVLADDFRLTGLVGVDFLLNAEGVWPIEVNPRFTASVEVIEQAYGLNAVQLHANACDQGLLPASSTRVCKTIAGKQIVFAPEEVRFSQAPDGPLRSDTGTQFPSLADIPRRGEKIEAGWPIATVLATGDSLHAVRAALRRKATRLLQICATKNGDK
jgi:predicted ATP-grasp superfamily ATP-dependent carboligase